MMSVKFEPELGVYNHMKIHKCTPRYYTRGDTRRIVSYHTSAYIPVINDAVYDIYRNDAYDMMVAALVLYIIYAHYRREFSLRNGQSGRVY